VIAKNSQRDYHTFRFQEPEITSYFPESEFREVINTDAFRRLKSIHFLGSIDYLLTGNRGVEERHTRFDHSLAVASLAKRFALAKDLSGSSYQNVVIAGLLHDIGHAPLSHSLEPAFKSIFSINHHMVGEKILRGEIRLGMKLDKVLTKYGINNFEIMSLISGHGSGLTREPFARSINVDTIEGIIRSASYLYRKELVINPVTVLDAFVELGKSSTDILDEFWILKNHVYSTIIQSPKGLIADFMCKRYMEINSSDFEKAYYYNTELDLRKQHGALFSALTDLRRNNIVDPALVHHGEVLRYTQRHFTIDTSVALRTYADIDKRYLQRKDSRVMEVKKRGGDRAHREDKYHRGESLF
jgi:uncharacterized protein